MVWVLLSWALTSASADARVISYAPVTDRQSVPAIQKRTNRFYALVERAPDHACSMCPFVDPPYGQLVVYDSQGREEPRVALPVEGGSVAIAAAAYRESANGTQQLLVLTNASLGGDNPAFRWGYLASGDAGRSWSRVRVPFAMEPSFVVGVTAGADRGGPVARGNGAQIQLGNDEVPFFFKHAGYAVGFAINALTRDLETLELRQWPANQVPSLLGTSLDGGEALVSTAGAGGDITLTGITSRGRERLLLQVGSRVRVGPGWIAPDGRAFVHATWIDWVPPTRHRSALWDVMDGEATDVAFADELSDGSGLVFGIPTSTGDGAWVVKVSRGSSTVLSRYTPGAPLAEAWVDPTGPEVEAIHAGASGQRLLIQVHRPRTPAPTEAPTKLVDPALAVWEVGSPAPRFYDELYLIERATKGFVHLDVDRLIEGAPFVFDGGEIFGTGGPVGGGPAGGGSAAGGAAVMQEWGIIKGSLRQRLLVPTVARTAGAHGAEWRTELLIHNPDARTVDLTLKFVPADGSGPSSTRAWHSTTNAGPRETIVTVAPGEIRRFPDVLADPLLVSSGSGALFLTPPIGQSVDATSRTYTVTSRGTFGMGVGAVDVFTALSPRFSSTFSAGLVGGGFRTNLVAVDVSGRGSEVAFDPVTVGPGTGARISLHAPPEGPAQANDVAAATGLRTGQTAGFLVRPVTGEAAFGAIVIDNLSNDPSWFGPDLLASVPRTIPAIVHADGAGGARFRSDLYVTNPGRTLQRISLAARGWASRSFGKTVTLSLLPGENRTIPDALDTLFGMTGVAQLSFLTGGSSGFLDPDAVRVTSRTYTLLPDGASYGISLPPLSSFQAAGPGDTLEILGPVGGASFRTNLALVDSSSSSTLDPPIPVRVDLHDERGTRIDTFEVRLPIGGGLQIDDLFRVRGLGNDPEAARIRVSPAGGRVAAYATTIDQGTNDPSYFAAQLAARD